MYDIHSHILPTIDDGAENLTVALDMARAYEDQGVLGVVCTPHILPGVYDNTGPLIRAGVAQLQTHINDAGSKLKLYPGADNHIVPNFVDRLRRGQLLSIADSRYVLVETPHHVAPAGLIHFFDCILFEGLVPILTHPERLTWIESKYEVICCLASRGVWMQVTSGSLRGKFGRRPRYWSERMIEEGLVHILASDAHGIERRRPDLMEGRIAAERLVGAKEAHHLVVTRPLGIFENSDVSALPAPERLGRISVLRGRDEISGFSNVDADAGFAQRVRGFFGL